MLLTHLIEALAYSLELDDLLIGGGIYILKGLHEDDQTDLFEVIDGLSRDAHIEGLAQRNLALIRQGGLVF